MITTLQLELEIQRAINDFLDRMPVSCRINYPELVEQVRKILAEQSFIPSTKLVDFLCHEIVNSRQDLIVQRGRGIVKIK